MPNKQWIDFAAVRQALSFEAVLAHYQLDLPAGRRQGKIPCPFHDDATPSCSINLDRGVFNCFGCDAKGNALDFIVRMEGGDKNDPAAMYAAAETAIAMMGRSKREFGRNAATPETPKTARRAPSTVKSTSSSSEPGKTDQSGPEGSGEAPSNPAIDVSLDLSFDHPFLVARGIGAELAEAYGVGLCHRGVMRGRIVFPIHNLAGELVAYAGRLAAEELPPDAERYRFPKHFRKSLELWNIHRAAACGGRHLTLVEGYWSAIRLNEAGLPVAALMGVSVSEMQARLIVAAGFRFVTLLLDGDEAGRTAAREAVHVLAGHVYVRRLDLPDGEKPDRMPDAWLQRLS